MEGRRLSRSVPVVEMGVGSGGMSGMSLGSGVELEEQESTVRNRPFLRDRWRSAGDGKACTVDAIGVAQGAATEDKVEILNFLRG